MRNTNWWKIAQPLDFSDRNLLNERIDTLKMLTVTLDRLSKLAFHTQMGTKGVLREVLEAKTLTTYPLIQQMIEAAEKVCMDSPQRASELCKQASEQIVQRVGKLEKERTSLIRKTMPNRWKGWRE